MLFWANNTSGTVDLEQVHRWRQVTNDFPTGSTYAHIATVHPSNEMFPNIENLSGMADLGFSNDTVTWNVQYNTDLTGTAVPLPLSTINHSFWADATAELSRTNDTFIVTVEAGFLQSLIALPPSTGSIGTPSRPRRSPTRPTPMRCNLTNACRTGATRGPLP